MEQTLNSTEMVNKRKKPVLSILISQPKPERSPYFELEEKFGIKVDFRKFIQVESVTLKEFRKQKIKLEDFPCIIFTSRQAVQHFFRICEELRIKMSQETKYFCLSKAVADYLQHFIVYRKRKVFYGERKIQDLKNSFNKYKTEKFLLPNSNLGSKAVVSYLEEVGIDFEETMLFRTVASDLSDLSDITYDMLVFFSPLGIHSLYENFPGFKQNATRIAAYGESTSKAVLEKNLILDIKAPQPGLTSMTMAIDNYLKESNNNL